jgi:hypothetical protein
MIKALFRAAGHLGSVGRVRARAKPMGFYFSAEGKRLRCEVFLHADGSVHGIQVHDYGFHR